MSSRRSRSLHLPRWWIGTFSLIIGLVAWFGIEVWRYIEAHRVLTYSQFEVCGQTIELENGYQAFDYRSRGNAEVPQGAFLYYVRPDDAEVGPPKTADHIFRVLPHQFADLIVGAPYEEWQEGWADLKPEDDDLIELGLVRFEDGCVVSVRLVYRSYYLYPRPGEWAITFYESRPD